MFCPNCGKQLNDNAKFCTGCGTSLQPAPVVTPQPAPVVTPQPAPVPAPVQEKNNAGKKKWIPIVCIAAAALLVISLVVILLVSGVFGGPKAKVFRAIVKSSDAFASCSEEANLPKADFISNSGAASHSLSVGIQSLPSAPELEVLDLQLDVAADLENREFYMTVLPTVGSLDFMKVQVGLENDMLLASAPNLLEDRVFAVNTTTLGSDLYELDLISADAETLGFNVFELIEIVEEYSQPDPEALKEIPKITKELLDTIEVERTGKEEIRVNDRTVKATVYRMTIPAEALEDAVRAIMDVYGENDTTDMTIALLEAIGMPDELIDEAIYNMDIDYANQQIEDAYDIILEGLDDVKVDFFIHKGYISAVEAEITVEDTDMELRLEIGGKENYVDEITMELDIMGEVMIEVNSSGNHTFKNNEFTDTTTVTISGEGMETVWMDFDLRYAPKSDSENLEWTVNSDYFRGSVEGQIDVEHNAVSIDLESIKLDVMGENILRCNVSYNGSPYQSAPPEGDEIIEPLRLSYDELMELSEELAFEVEDKMTEIVTSDPAMFDLIEGMM